MEKNKVFYASRYKRRYADDSTKELPLPQASTSKASYGANKVDDKAQQGPSSSHQMRKLSQIKGIGQQQVGQINYAEQKHQVRHHDPVYKMLQSLEVNRNQLEESRRKEVKKDEKEDDDEEEEKETQIENYIGKSFYSGRKREAHSSKTSSGLLGSSSRSTVNKREETPRSSNYGCAKFQAYSPIPSVRAQPGPAPYYSSNERQETPRNYYTRPKLQMYSPIPRVWVRPGPPSHWSTDRLEEEESPRSEPASPGPGLLSKCVNGLKIPRQVDPDDQAIIKKRLMPKPRKSMWERPPPQDLDDIPSYHNDYEIAQREKEMKQRQLSDKLKDILKIPRTTMYKWADENDNNSDNSDDYDIVSIPDSEVCKTMSEDLRQLLNIGFEVEVSKPVLPVMKEEEGASQLQALDTVNGNDKTETEKKKIEPVFFIYNKYRYHKLD